MKFFENSLKNTYCIKRINLIIMIMIFLSVLVSCKKYEDGPLLSLRSAKNRLTGSWVSKEIYINNLFAELDNNLYTLIIKRNNTLNLSNNYSKLEGSWELVSNKELISILVTEVEPNTGFVKKDSWEILRLTNNDLWIKFSYFENLTEIRFKKIEK